MTNQEFLESISLEGEEWKPVVGWEDSYLISSHGRCVSTRRSKWQLLTVSIQNVRPNYKRVVYTLMKNGYRKSAKAHILVAEAFIPRTENCNQIDHIDGNTMNNHVSNLRWCNNKQNMNNPITTKRISDALKGNSSAPKKGVVAIYGSDTRFYNSIRDVEKDGFYPASVCRCCKGILSQHKGYKWMYLSDYENLLSAMSKNSLDKGGE